MIILYYKTFYFTTNFYCMRIKILHHMNNFIIFKYSRTGTSGRLNEKHRPFLETNGPRCERQVRHAPSRTHAVDRVDMAGWKTEQPTASETTYPVGRSRRNVVVRSSGVAFRVSVSRAAQRGGSTRYYRGAFFVRRAAVGGGGDGGVTRRRLRDLRSTYDFVAHSRPSENIYDK